MGTVIRTVQVMCHHDDDTLTLEQYDVPEEWAPPADWHRTSSVFVPSMTVATAEAEANRIGMLAVDGGGGE
jgi:hypothetical protein